MLIIAGSIVTLVGVMLLIYCIAKVWMAKRQNLDDAALEAQIKAVVMLNMIAMGVSGLGLMIVIIGLVF